MAFFTGLLSQIPTLSAEDEGYGVHEVGLPGPVRTDDAREGEEGSDALRSRVGFEVLELEVGHRHLWIVLLLL